MSVIPTLGRLRQEDCELDASLGYTAKPYLRKKKKIVEETKSEGNVDTRGWSQRCTVDGFENGGRGHSQGMQVASFLIS
jgi:hypothetical protein